MCVIILAAHDKDIPIDHLQQAIRSNPEGWGLLAYDDKDFNKAKPVYGWTEASAKRAWREAKGKTRIFHARIATSGEKDVYNLHPFDATSPSGVKRWFFHNGTVAMPLFNPKRSDTWHLAQFIRTQENSEEFLDGLASYAVKEVSRFLLVTPETVWRMGNGWVERDGVWYSNHSAFSQRAISGSRSYGAGGTDYTWRVQEKPNGHIWSARVLPGSNKHGALSKSLDWRRFNDGVWRPLTVPEFKKQYDQEIAAMPRVNASAEPAEILKSARLIADHRPYEELIHRLFTGYYPQPGKVSNVTSAAAVTAAEDRIINLNLATQYGLSDFYVEIRIMTALYIKTGVETTEGDVRGLIDIYQQQNHAHRHAANRAVLDGNYCVHGKEWTDPCDQCEAQHKK